MKPIRSGLRRAPDNLTAEYCIAKLDFRGAFSPASGDFAKGEPDCEALARCLCGYGRLMLSAQAARLRELAYRGSGTQQRGGADGAMYLF